MGGAIECPIWGTAAREMDSGRYGDFVRVDSPRAGGAYKITGTAVAMVSSLSETQRVELTNWIVEQHKLGDPCPEISSFLVRRIRDSQPTRPSAAQRHDNLILYLEASTKELGERIKIAGAMDDEYARRQMEFLAHTSSTNEREVQFLINQAESADLIQSMDSGRAIQLTLKGYDYVASLKSQELDSKQGFVAMWFDSSMSEIYDAAIEPAIREAGYKALRIDRKEHNNKIDDEIVAEIRRSRFVVTDFTSEPQKPRGGVYFEAGFALGLGRPVIWTCRSDIIGEVHFDTRQFNHIVWSTTEELRSMLKNRIVAVIGPGPLQPLP